MQLQCQNITKTYDNTTILEVEHLTIPSGAMIGIVGENGCGKTTLISILGNVLNPTEGSLRYDDKLLTSEVAKFMTTVFQKPILLRGSAKFNISYPLKIRKFPKDHLNYQVDEMLKQLDLYACRYQDVSTLSGGQKQKVALGRALIFSPRLLLLDEPTSNIDPVCTIAIENTIKKVNQAGTTVVLVTHSLVQAANLCSHLIFMKNGKIHEQGATEELLYRPRKQQTKNFLKNSVLYGENNTYEII